MKKLLLLVASTALLFACSDDSAFDELSEANAQAKRIGFRNLTADLTLTPGSENPPAGLLFWGINSILFYEGNMSSGFYSNESNLNFAGSHTVSGSDQSFDNQLINGQFFELKSVNIERIDINFGLLQLFGYNLNYQIDARILDLNGNLLAQNSVFTSNISSQYTVSVDMTGVAEQSYYFIEIDIIYDAQEEVPYTATFIGNVNHTNPYSYSILTATIIEEFNIHTPNGTITITDEYGLDSIFFQLYDSYTWNFLDENVKINSDQITSLSFPFILYNDEQIENRESRYNVIITVRGDTGAIMASTSYTMNENDIELKEMVNLPLNNTAIQSTYTIEIDISVIYQEPAGTPVRFNGNINFINNSPYSGYILYGEVSQFNIITGNAVVTFREGDEGYLSEDMFLFYNPTHNFNFIDNKEIEITSNTISQLSFPLYIYEAESPESQIHEFEVTITVTGNNGRVLATRSYLRSKEIDEMVNLTLSTSELQTIYDVNIQVNSYLGEIYRNTSVTSNISLTNKNTSATTMDVAILGVKFLNAEEEEKSYVGNGWYYYTTVAPNQIGNSGNLQTYNSNILVNPDTIIVETEIVYGGGTANTLLINVYDGNTLIGTGTFNPPSGDMLREHPVKITRPIETNNLRLDVNLTNR